MFRFLLPALLLSSFAIGQNSENSIYLYFDLDERNLNQGHRQVLDSLSKTLLKGDALILAGYADFLGNPAYNKKLSLDRAQNAKNYILGKNQEVKSITAYGEGAQAKPADANPVSGVPTHRLVRINIEREKLAANEIPATEAKPAKPVGTVSKEDIYEMMKEGENLVWDNLNFQPGRHFLLPESYPSLEKLLEMLQQYPNLKIGIEGHICCERVQADGHDWDTGENNLSVNRARYIYDYLVQKGIDDERLSYKGFGGKKPLVVYEVTESDRTQNRRVEIKVISK